MVIDLHSDTALKLLKGNTIYSDDNQFKLNDALKYDKYIQLFAAYIEPEFVVTNEFDLCVRLINAIRSEVNENKEYMKIITNRKELEEYMNEKSKKVGVILTVEDATCLNGNIDNLQKLYDLGIRAITLTWNNKNDVACGVNYSERDEGLTLFGKEVIKRMNELNIIVDVSHLSEKSFYDVMKITNKPVIASHSCAKAICNHKRNLTDEQIKIIASRGGIIGVNFYKDFLSDETSKVDVDCVAKHIKHIYNIGGSKCVSIGSDYDGMNIDKVAMNLENNGKLVNLVDALKKSNFDEEDIDRIMWKNQLEFLLRELSEDYE